MESIAATAIEAARENGMSEIKCIHLKIGALSGVNIDALQFAFEAFRANGDLTCESLDIERVFAKGKCNACSTSFEVEAFWQVCPDCGSVDISYEGGLDFCIFEIDGD